MAAVNMRGCGGDRISTIMNVKTMTKTKTMSEVYMDSVMDTHDEQCSLWCGGIRLIVVETAIVLLCAGNSFSISSKQTIVASGCADGIDCDCDCVSVSVWACAQNVVNVCYILEIAIRSFLTESGIFRIFSRLRIAAARQYCMGMFTAHDT